MELGGEGRGKRMTCESAFVVCGKLCFPCRWHRIACLLRGPGKQPGTIYTGYCDGLETYLLALSNQTAVMTPQKIQKSKAAEG